MRSVGSALLERYSADLGSGVHLDQSADGTAWDYDHRHRQLGLFVLTHDASHMALFSNRKLNDWVAQWVLNRPHTDASIDVYRRYHIQHHLHTSSRTTLTLRCPRRFP